MASSQESGIQPPSSVPRPSARSHSSIPAIRPNRSFTQSISTLLLSSLSVKAFKMSSSAVGQKGSKGKKAMSLFMSLLTFAHVSLSTCTSN